MVLDGIQQRFQFYFIHFMLPSELKNDTKYKLRKLVKTQITGEVMLLRDKCRLPHQNWKKLLVK